MNYKTSRKEINGLDSTIQLRANQRNVGSTNPMHKETITAVDVIELIKRTPIGSMEELQRKHFCFRKKNIRKFKYKFSDITLLLFLTETGLRIGSVIGVHLKVNGFPGILLKDIKIKYV